MAAWAQATPTNAQVHNEFGLYILLLTWTPPAGLSTKHGQLCCAEKSMLEDLCTQGILRDDESLRRMVGSYDLKAGLLGEMLSPRGGTLRRY